jgi:hypothetical protein
MNIQINELGKGEKANKTLNRYPLRSKKKEGNLDSQDYPFIAERPTKSAAITTKEKKAQNTSPAVKEPVSEVREDPKTISPLILSMKFKRSGFLSPSQS